MNPCTCPDTDDCDPRERGLRPIDPKCPRHGVPPLPPLRSGQCGECFACRRQQCRERGGVNNPHNSYVAGGYRCAHCTLGRDGTYTLPEHCPNLRRVSDPLPTRPLPPAESPTRAMTEDEVREKFILKVWSMIRWWETESRKPAARDKLEGLAFSLLSMLDGSSDLPEFKVCPDPHPEDKAYHQENGENWWPTDDVDIAGSLHDQFYEFGRKHGYVKD